MSSPVRDGARGDIGDQAVADRQRAVDDFVGEHDARIAQDQFGGHFRQSFFLRRGSKRQ